MSTQPDEVLARLIHRFDVLTGKLSVVKLHWAAPGNCCGEDLGAIAIVRESADELETVYCELNDWLHDKQLLQPGPLVGSFDEKAEPKEGQS